MFLLDKSEDLSILKHDALLQPNTNSAVSSAESDGENASGTSDTELSETSAVVDQDVLKRQARKAAFDNHIKSDKEADRITSKTKRDVDLSGDDNQPENSRIIDQVRTYQQELFERAKEENVIAVLDTGSGKTLIACLLIRYMLDKERVNRAEGKQQKIIFFLANSVHLVEQQTRVLANNLIDVPLMMHSQTKDDLTQKASWTKHKENYKVVVCTPAILYQALGHSHITIAEISLLIFDEAHHAKKDHPYSRIVRTLHTKPLETRPKIFGMTASAVDTKGRRDGIAEEARALEELLQAKIVTTEDSSLLSFAPKPQDVRWVYRKAHTRFDTDLCHALRTKAYFCHGLRRAFEFSRKATTELGPWCADRVWKHVIGNTSQESSRFRRTFEQSEAYSEIATIEEREDALIALDEAALLVQSHDFQAQPTRDSTCLSEKVLVVVSLLEKHYHDNPDTRAIVFVDERLKARVLQDCFEMSAVPNIRSGVLLGIAARSGEASSVKEQERVLKRFRAGLINLVFATSVADEGLDIPQCNLCVRFDLCKTTIQYMQSRGRARMKGSIFAHMVEEDNFDHYADVEYQIENEDYIKKWCSSLAPDRRLGRGTKLAKLLARDASDNTFPTSSGATCDSSNALEVLARFAASLQHTGAAEKESYTEEIDLERNLFKYTVRLPANTGCPFPGCKGDWKTNKQLAKRSAAWKCCWALRQGGYLDDNLDSVFQKVKPENANAHLAVTKKLSKYDMQIKPTAWQTHLDIIPPHLFATVLTFSPSRSLKHKMASVVVLTKSPLPVMPTFLAYLEDGIKTEVRSERITSALPVTEAQLKLLTAFVLDGVFSDVFNKVYAHEPEKMSYWLVPMKLQPSPVKLSLTDLVDMAALETVTEERVQWKPGMSANAWVNKFLCDPLNGKFHYFTADVVPEARITDPIPDHIPKIPQKKRRNIYDFSDSTWTASKKKNAEEKFHDREQPVLSADLILTKRNFLDPTATKDQKPIPCLIAPQTLQIARLSPEFAASCLVWPALIHRIEAYMITMEAFDLLELPGIPADLALEAFTKDADNDEEEELPTYTSGTRGMGKNYERLEFIGDSLLKMTSTMTVYNMTICDEEGMHCRRMEILCNRNLFNVATSDDLRLYRYARTCAFDRTTWYPEHLKLLHGRGAKREPVAVVHQAIEQDLGMKTVADMSEAIIGAAITSGNHSASHNHRFDLGIQAVTKLVQSKYHDVYSWSDIASQYKPPAWSLQTNDPVANDRAGRVAAKTGYKFKHSRLLRSAFTHSSDMNSPVPDLQRLEFLGDAVLDWVCISWLFNTNPTRNPQWLTEHKMAMVSNKFLAALAITLDFDKFIFVTTAKLIGDIQLYANKVREVLAQPNWPKNFWTEIEGPPKALSDLVESYLGAVLVDSGFDYAEMERFFDSHVKHFFENISDYDTFANRHPTTYLYNKLGQEYKCRDYAIQDSSDPVKEAIEVEIIAGVVVHNKVISESRGTSARYARVRASKLALNLLESMSREEFKYKYGCYCTAIKD